MMKTSYESYARRLTRKWSLQLNKRRAGTSEIASGELLPAVWNLLGLKNTKVMQTLRIKSLWKCIGSVNPKRTFEFNNDDVSNILIYFNFNLH